MAHRAEPRFPDSTNADANARPQMFSATVRLQRDSGTASNQAQLTPVSSPPAWTSSVRAAKYSMAHPPPITPRSSIVSTAPVVVPTNRAKRKSTAPQKAKAHYSASRLPRPTAIGCQTRTAVSHAVMYRNTAADPSQVPETKGAIGLSLPPAPPNRPTSPAWREYSRAAYGWARNPEGVLQNTRREDLVAA